MLCPAFVGDRAANLIDAFLSKCCSHVSVGIHFRFLRIMNVNKWLEVKIRIEKESR